MISFCVHRPVATSMAFAALLLLGITATYRLRIDLFPDISFPRISVMTPYSGVEAEEIESLITRPVENALSAVPGVRRIRSISQEGLSIVHADLKWGTSVDGAIIQARQKVDLARSTLPQDTGKSVITRFDPSSHPIITLAVHPASRLPEKKTRDYTERNLRPLLERIEGVASVTIHGGFQREIQVNLDRDRLRSYNLSLFAIGQNLAASNYTFPAGTLRKGPYEYRIKVKGDYETVDSLRHAIVAVGKENQSPITLADLGSIVDGYRDRTAAAVHNGRPAVLVMIKKEPGKNAVQTARRIQADLKHIQSRLRQYVSIEVLNDSSRYIVESIDSILFSALLGASIAFAVLLFFLGSSRTAGMILLSVPVSVLFTLLLMYFTGVSINVISLGGLALGTGMLVDNSIVVIESIQQFREKGLSSERDSAIQGAHAVSGSVIASTATSIVVFLPILFVPGIAGAIFKDLALTVTFSLIGSLLVSLTLIPMLASLTNQSPFLDQILSSLDQSLQPAYIKATSAVNMLKKHYTTLLAFSLKRSGMLFLTMGIFSGGGIILLLCLDRELFPEADTKAVNLQLTLQDGSSVQESEAFIVHLHHQIRSGLRHAITLIGSEDEGEGYQRNGKRYPHQTTSLLYLHQGFDTAEYARWLDETMDQIPGIRHRIAVRGNIIQDLLGSDRHIYFEVEAVQRDKARSVCEDVYRRLSSDNRIARLDRSSRPSIPEIRITFDRLRLAATGLSIRDAALALRAAIHGEVSTVFREQDVEIDVRLRFQEADRNASADLQRIPAALPDGTLIELGSFITSKRKTGYESLIREDQRRLERIEIETSHADSSLMRDLTTLKEQLEASDPGLQIRIHKGNQETLQSLQHLLLAFLLSSILIYQLLAAQFESLVHPFTLILSIPMMFSGASSALFLTGNTVNIQSTIGLVMLTGIVVNNAIVLYESISKRLQTLEERQRIQELPRVLQEAGCERLRPILLSSLTTILALLPLAFTSGSGMQAPLAIVVIGGLSVSSFLTLLGFPVIYYRVERRLAERRRRNR